MQDDTLLRAKVSAKQKTDASAKSHYADSTFIWNFILSTHQVDNYNKSFKIICFALRANPN